MKRTLAMVVMSFFAVSQTAQALDFQDLVPLIAGTVIGAAAGRVIGGDNYGTAGRDIGGAVGLIIGNSAVERNRNNRSITECTSVGQFRNGQQENSATDCTSNYRRNGYVDYSQGRGSARNDRDIRQDNSGVISMPYRDRHTEQVVVFVPAQCQKYQDPELLAVCIKANNEEKNKIKAEERLAAEVAHKGLIEEARKAGQNAAHEP